MDNDEEYRRARRTVKSIKAFYVHVSIFILVMTLLLAINVTSGGAW